MGGIPRSLRLTSRLSNPIQMLGTFQTSDKRSASEGLETNARSVAMASTFP